jgi:transcription antitermination factor NusG
MAMIELNPEASNPDAGEWSAVYTRHQHEKSVAVSLSRNLFDVFLPLYNVVRQWKDRKKHLSLPLFPGYVFFRGGPERRVQILSMPGVHSIVSIAGKPAPIPAIEIDAIRRAVESHLEVEPHPFLRDGDRVRIQSGPLAGIEGILVRRKSAYRLILSAELLERSIAVEVDAFSVDPLPHPVAALPPSSTRTQPFMYYRAAG